MTFFRSGGRCARVALVAATTLLATAGVVSAQVADSEGPVPPVRESFRIDAMLVPQGPRIDGILDDEVWALAPMVDDFTQQEPAEGMPATERTEVRALYDGSRLFIGVLKRRPQVASQ
jgi:hypothetical protein